MANKKRAPRVRRPRVARRKMARKVAREQFATATQTISLNQVANNIVYRLDDVNLSQFDRLAAIGQCYQFFKFNMIEVRFKPLMDTYLDSNNQSVPYLHYLIMKGDTIDTGTFNKLRDAGAKPIRFDDKTIVVKYRPYVLAGVIGEDTNNATNPTLVAWSQHRTSPWLATTYLPGSETVAWSPSKVPHKGLLYGAEQDNSVVTHYYDVTITVHASFKKPLTYGTAGVEDPGSTHVVLAP